MRSRGGGIEVNGRTKVSGGRVDEGRSGAGGARARGGSRCSSLTTANGRNAPADMAFVVVARERECAPEEPDRGLGARDSPTERRSCVGNFSRRQFSLESSARNELIRSRATHARHTEHRPCSARRLFSPPCCSRSPRRTPRTPPRSPTRYETRRISRRPDRASRIRLPDGSRDAVSVVNSSESR